MKIISINIIVNPVYTFHDSASTFFNTQINLIWENRTMCNVGSIRRFDVYGNKDDR